MRALPAMVVAALALGVGSGCGGQEEEPLVVLPASGTAYRALSERERLAVAERCRDDGASAARGRAATELADVRLAALREQLDAAYSTTRTQRRPVAEVCAEQIPFVTPGLEVAFDGARDSGYAFTFETDSDVPLELRGAVTPAPREGTVVARRESGGARGYRGRIAPDGRFDLPAIPLRKVADNTFIVSIHAPPSALRKLYFSAICLDCLITGPP